MILSPSERGIVMIGGGVNQKVVKPSLRPSTYLLELSGNLEETLEQKLQFTRLDHISFSISNDIAASLTMKSIDS